MVSKVASALMSFFFEYDTVKLVHIKSKKIGLISRLVQLLVIAYVIAWVLVWNKGYQRFDIGVSGVTTKVKGVQYTNYSTIAPEIGSRIWDVADYVIPPQENGAFFVMTNMIVTPNQTHGRCEEDPSVREALCASDFDCPAGRPLLVGNGAFTGRCINSTRATSTMVCEVYAWCPVERNKPSVEGPILTETRNFTVLIKNNVFFPYFEKHRSNIIKDANRTYLRSCVFNSNTDPFCPIFRLGDVIESIGNESFKDMATSGGVVAIRIDWNCDFDLDDDLCRPKYVFTRMDAESGVGAFKGYNFRTAYQYEADGVPRRTLVKAYGILFQIVVNAKAGAFNIVPLLLNLGSGLALLGIATIVCDLVMLLFHRRRKAFKSAVYELVRSPGSLTQRQTPTNGDVNGQTDLGREKSAAPTNRTCAPQGENRV